MIKLFDIVKLKDAKPDYGITADTTGTVVDIASDGAYTVEFFDKSGQTIEDGLFLYFQESELELVADDR